MAKLPSRRTLLHFVGGLAAVLKRKAWAIGAHGSVAHLLCRTLMVREDLRRERALNGSRQRRCRVRTAAVSGDRWYEG